MVCDAHHPGRQACGPHPSGYEEECACGCTAYFQCGRFSCPHESSNPVHPEDMIGAQEQ